MRIFTNTRTWRVQFILWLFAALTILFAVMALYGLATGDEGNAAVGGILTPIMLVSTGGMELYARRYVTSIDSVDKAITLTTRSLTGVHVHHGAADLGPLRNLMTLSFAESGVQSTNTSHFTLKLQPANKNYIVDVTSDPKLADRLRTAFQ